ncbi:hypothetical protein P280DRAFT_550518 [Massarina eburnea CBS 473.64]|uniref:Uncharacterized protein n=1 Tax=Massarina eburnea CBS 473.64 TaxID=1395130 RepID=A0A6A6RXF6_9PLEO|nr:hypothetical protein P280DRAFT_550518 [Massarina eburnea CBS 473.64]
MAPTPTDNQPSAHPTSTSTPPPKAWNTGTIVLGAVFLGFIVVFLTSLIIYITRRRAARNKLHPEMRSRSYHPFRTASTDKAALLANVSPNGGDNNERRKISMFSHERHTSVSLYVDTDAVDQRVSRDRLIPLHTTLSEEETGSLTQGSTGSGVSGGTSRHSGGTEYEHDKFKILCDYFSKKQCGADHTADTNDTDNHTYGLAVGMT